MQRNRNMELAAAQFLVTITLFKSHFTGAAPLCLMTARCGSRLTTPYCTLSRNDSNWLDDSGANSTCLAVLEFPPTPGLDESGTLGRVRDGEGDRGHKVPAMAKYPEPSRASWGRDSVCLKLKESLSQT